MTEPVCPDHPKCSKCGTELEYVSIPSGSGMSDSVRCPNKCAVNHGINAVLHMVGFHADTKQPLCRYNDD